MKKILLLFVVLFIMNNAFSQIKFGVKTGVNFASLSDVEDSYADGYSWTIFQKDGMTTGFNVGVFTNVSLGNIISFQPELLFSMQGGKQLWYEHLNGGSGIVAGPNMKYQLGYVQLPLLIEIKPVANFGVLFGAQFGFNVSRKTVYTYDGKSEYYSESEFYYFYDHGFKKNNADLVFGLQYTFIEKIIIGARYNLGLSNNLHFSYDNWRFAKGWKSNVIQTSLSFLF